jgi:hypothetical protein
VCARAVHLLAGSASEEDTTVTEQQKTRFRRLQDRLGDPLLTVLTTLFALMLFVIAPLHAAGVFASEDVGLAVGVVVIGTVVFAYGLSPAVIAGGGAGPCCGGVFAPPSTSIAPRSLP